MSMFGEKFIELLLVEPLLHGDDSHREWLKKELRSKASILDKFLEETMNDLTFEVSVTAIIKRPQDGRMLILQRSPNKRRFPGMWTVPGGHLERKDYCYGHPNSDGWWYNVLQNVAHREVFEETGLRIQNVRFLCDMVGEMGGRVLVISLVADLEPGYGLQPVQLALEESSAWAWVTAAEAKGYKLIEGIQEELEAAEKL